MAWSAALRFRVCSEAGTKSRAGGFCVSVRKGEVSRLSPGCGPD